MNHQKVLFFKVLKDNKLLLIRGYYSVDPDYFVQVIIKQDDILKVVRFLKKLDHDPEVDIENDSNDNISSVTYETINDSDYDLFIGAHKYNYQFVNNEFELYSFWKSKEINSHSIDIPYKNYEDLRMQLDALIAEIEKVL